MVESFLCSAANFRLTFLEPRLPSNREMCRSSWTCITATYRDNYSFHTGTRTHLHTQTITILNCCCCCCCTSLNFGNESWMSLCSPDLNHWMFKGKKKEKEKTVLTKAFFSVDVASCCLFSHITCDIPLGSVHPAPTAPFFKRKD